MSDIPAIDLPAILRAALSRHYCRTWVDEATEDPQTLVDVLSSGGTIESGEEEIEGIVDAVLDALNEVGVLKDGSLGEVSLFGSYLAGLSANPRVSPFVVERSRRLWSLLAERNIHPPHGGPTGAGSLIFAWDAEALHVEVEIYDSLVEWFYCDTQTAKRLSGEGSVEEAVRFVLSYLRPECR